MLTAVALVVLTGCVPGTPDVNTWREKARHAVSDVSSQVATVGLVLAQDGRGSLLGAYDRVVATYAEEAAGKATQSISGAQPPDAERQQYDSVTKALDDASSLLSEARIAITNGTRTEYRDLAHRLDRVGSELDDLETQLQGDDVPPGARP